MKQTLIAAPLVLAMALPSMAQETTTLLRFKDWIVRHEFYPNSNGQACAARTANRYGDVLDITAWDSGTLKLYLFMDRNFEGFGAGSFEADVILDIDYERWNLNDADIRDGDLYFEFGPGQKTIEFLSDLMNANAVALKSPSGSKTMATWSLRGSYASMLKLMECWNMILEPDRSDTYQGVRG